MPAAPDELLLESLAGHPGSALDHTFLGCMTRIFHIFEGHPGGAFMGRRSSSSTRLGINDIDSGRSQLRIQADSHPNRHDRGNADMQTGDGHKRTVQPTSHHHRSHSDITDMAATPSRTFSEDTKPASSEDTRHAYSSEGRKSAYSYEDAMDRSVAFNNYESLRAAANFAGDPRRLSDLSHREKRMTPKGSSRQQQQLLLQKPSSSSEIRDSLLATFLPETGAHPDLSRKKNTGAGCRRGARVMNNTNNAVFARGLEPSELLQWKDGLRSSSPAPKDNRSKSPSRSSSAAGAPKLIVSHHSSPDRRVDPPKKKKSQKKTPSPQGKNLNCKEVNTELQKSPGALCFRESLKPFMAGDSQKFESRLESSSGQNLSNARDTSVNVIARLMGLEENVKCVSLTSKVKDARLSRGETFFRGLVQFDPQMAVRSTSLPAFCHTKKHDYNRMQEDQCPENYPEQYNMEQRLSCYDEDRDYEHLPMSKPFLPFEDGYKEPPKLLADAFQAEDHASYGAAQAEIFPGSLMKQSTQKKKMLWKILEAMRPKGLLKMSRRKQQMEPTGTNYSVIEHPIQQALVTQRDTIDSRSSCGLEKDEISRNADSVKQEQQTGSSNSTSTESESIVKRCILPPHESTVEMTKPVNYSLNSENDVDTFRVRQVETAIGNLNEKGVCQTIRAAQTNSEEEGHLGGNGQRKATKPRAALEDTTRSTSLESHCEIIDPSSGRESDIKADNVHKSRKIRTATTRKPTPNHQRTVSLDTERKHRQGLRASSPEVSRPSLSKRAPSKDHNILGRKSPLEPGGKKDAHPKAQFAREDTLKRRVSRAGAKAGAVRLKESNFEGAVATPPEEVVVDVSRPSTTEPVSLLDTSGLNSNSFVQIQPQPSDSQHPVCKTSKEPHVYTENQLSEEQSEVQSKVQMIEGDSVGDLKCHEPPKPYNSGAWSTEPDHEPQTSPQIQEAEIEASDELTTPRGVKLKCKKLDGNLVEEMNRPSPVSVLDPTAFDEDLTLSPISSSNPNHAVPIMQDSMTTETFDEEHEGTCFIDFEAADEAPPAALEDDLDLEESFNERYQVENTEPENSIDAESDGTGAFSVDPEMAATSYKSSDNKMDQVTMISDKPQQPKQRTGFEFQEPISPAAMINDALLQALQVNGVIKENDHRLLLQCLEEIMERVLVESQQSAFSLWAGLPAESLRDSTASVPCKGRRLEQELWQEMQNMKPQYWSSSSKSSSSSSEDVCDAVHELLLGNLVRCHGRQWGSFSGERERVGVDVESLIVGELIEEAVRELCGLEREVQSKSLGGASGVETARRQLFARSYCCNT